MAVAVFAHAFDARRRLAELGVSIEAVQKAVRAGKLARLSCTDNDPPFIPGTEAWRLVVRTLREELLPKGWHKSDPGNYSLVSNDARKINIVVATGDNLTRVYPGTPKTKSLKGLYTEGAVVRNLHQDDLFPDSVAEELRAVAAILGYPVWILLIHITDEECRAELSLPCEVDGTVVDWSERIFIPDDEEGGGASIKSDDDLGPEFDVPVKLKA
jgi:hypothetical protein